MRLDHQEARRGLEDLVRGQGRATRDDDLRQKISQRRGRRLIRRDLGVFVAQQALDHMVETTHEARYWVRHSITAHFLGEQKLTLTDWPVL